MDPTFWNERYGKDGWAYGTEPNDFVREQAAAIPRGRVLCLAEGEGRNAVFLAGLGHAVTAMDFSEKALEKTRKLAQEKGVTVEVVQGDLETFEPEAGAFTGIIAIWAHVPSAIRRRVHEWVPRALVPGGVFLLEAYTPDQIPLDTGGPKNPDLLPTLALLKDELAPLDVVIGREVVREVHEGPFHGGKSATVQFLAKKR